MKYKFCKAKDVKGFDIVSKCCVKNKTQAIANWFDLTETEQELAGIFLKEYELRRTK